MAQLVVGAVGAVIGFVGSGFNPMGAAYGWSIGTAIGAVAFTPTQKNQGPRLDDLKVAGTDYGQPIPWVQGSPRLAGQMIWSSDRRRIDTTTRSGGKGGPKVRNTTYTYEIDCLYQLSSNQLAALMRVWDNGKLVFSARDDATDDTLIASNGSELWRRITFYSGDPAQQPDPAYQAAVGIEYSPAYRHCATVFIEGLQLGNSGQMRNLTFEPASSAVEVIRENFQDYSGNALPVRRTTNPVLDGFAGTFDTVAKFEASGLFFGNFIAPRHGLLIGDVAADMGFGAADFTVDCFLYCQHDNYEDGAGAVFSNGGNAGVGAGMRMRFDEDGAFRWTSRNNSGNDFDSGLGQGLTPPAIYPLQQWFHLECSREQDIFRIFIDGTLVNQWTFSGTLLNIALGEIGAAQAQLQSWQGYIDDFVVSTECRHGANFTPRTAPHVPDQFTRLYVPFYRLTAIQKTEEALHDVVARLCNRAGMAAGTYDVTALEDIETPVRGLAVSQVGSTRATLEILMAAYYFEAVCSDKIYFVPRVRDVVTVIPYEDLGSAPAMEDGPEPLPFKQNNDLEAPAQVAVTASNFSNDYQPFTEYSDRLLSGQVSPQTVEIPLAFTPSEVKSIADATLMDSVIGMVGTQIALKQQYARLQPADSVLVQAKDGSTFRMRLRRLAEQAGVMSFDCSLEDATVFTQAGITSDDYTPQTVVTALPGTFLLMLDIPLLRDADDGVGLYAAARGIGSVGWPGAEVYESTDDVLFDPRVSFTDSGTLGSCQTALGTWAGLTVFDEVNSVTVNVGLGTLSSATREAILASFTTNAALIGNEVVQFKTATLVSTGIYTLTGLLRGRRGTEQHMASHRSGERFVLLEAAGMRRVLQGNSDVGATRYFKGVTFGRSLSTAASQAVVNTGASQKPFSSVDARANRTSTDTVITWRRRTRMESRFLSALGASTPLGEFVEAYAIEIYTSSAFTTLVRTLTSSTPTATYTSAQQVTDFGTNQSTLYTRIYQLSETVGRGFPLQATI